MVKNREVIVSDIHGEPIFGNSQYVANAAEVGSLGRGIATSGFTVGSGAFTELQAGLTYRKVLTIQNYGSDVVFIGPSGALPAAISYLYPLAGSGGQIAFNVTSGVKVYGVTDGTSVDVRVLEIG